MANDIQRDPDLWLEDGNVVIVANSTTAFRVYKGLLGRVSAIFEETFKFKPDPGETIDSGPVVHVPDSPVEMGHFLRAVFRSGLSLSRQHPIPFATIASIIRIAHKYQAQEILDAASDRLANFLVPGPGHWIDATTLSWKERWELGQKQCSITFEPKDAIEAVNLAHLIENPLILPVGFYLCCLMDPIQLRDGVARADGVLEKLSDRDFARCMRTIPVLATRCHGTVLRLLNVCCSAAPHGCSRCGTKFGGMLDRYIETINIKQEHIPPLSDLLVRADRRVTPASVWSRNTLCSACDDSSPLNSFGEECVKTRKCLSKYFAIEGMDEVDFKLEGVELDFGIEI
ncbi:hypothetical protein V8D89_001800 [Ganoderma adspersum]